MKKNNFLDQLRRKQQAAATHGQKPTSEMTEAELDAEEARLRAEIRRSKEEAVEAGREAMAGSASGSLQTFLSSRRRRAKRPWK